MLHPLLDDYYYPYANGIKTGYTKEAGNCLITMAENKHITFLAIVLKSVAKKIDDKWIAMSYIDAKNLFEWGFKSFEKAQFDSYIADKPIFGYLAILFRLFI